MINEKVYHPEVWTPSEANGVDLLIVSLKYGALPGAVDSIKEAVGDNTIIMSLMNGVDSEEIISEKVDASTLSLSNGAEISPKIIPIVVSGSKQ